MQNYISARDIEDNLHSKVQYLPKVLGYEVQVTQQCTIVNCALNTDMFNIVCNVDFSNYAIEDTPTRLTEIIHHFDGQPIAWWVTSRFLTRMMRQTLEVSGIRLASIERLMYCDLIQNQDFIDVQNAAVQAAAAFDICVVETAEQVAEWAQLIATYDKKAAELYMQIPESLLRDKEQPFKLYIGSFQGKVVAMGSLFFTENVAGIFDVITMEEYRGRGFGKAMMLRLMYDAMQCGYKFVSLSASSDEGFSLYKKLCFEKVGEMYEFSWRPGNKTGIEISAKQAEFLQKLLRDMNAQNVLEIGAYHGFSARAMARAIPADGMIISIEQNKENIQVAQKESAEFNNIKFINGNAMNILPTLEGVFDLIFIDANKSKYPEYFAFAKKLVRVGGIIVADNVLFRGYVTDKTNNYPKKYKNIVYALRRFMQDIKNDANFETKILDMEDGMSVSVRKV